MFLRDDLKSSIKITDTTVECPVKGCDHFVERQRRSFRREDRYRCPTHQIFISPTTFEYEDLWCNVTERGMSDRQLMNQMKSKRIKRETHRLARNNSEDAVTWSVFRYLEKNKLLDLVVNTKTGDDLSTSQVIYWSYSPISRGPWEPLVCARNIFGEKQNRSTEPDLIIETDKALIFIECKIAASNKTKPSNPESLTRYEGGNDWFHEVFQAKESLFSVAVDAQLYELMRMWLLGTWIAANKLNGKKFILINLTKGNREQDIEEKFGNRIMTCERRQFKRFTWEELYWSIERFITDEQFSEFFRKKTLGYSNGKLIQMFDV